MLWTALFFPQLYIDRLVTEPSVTDEIEINGTGANGHSPNQPKPNLPESNLPAPGLSKDALSGAVTERDVPLVVITKTGNRSVVMSANRSARQSGIRAGTALNSAYAIVPDLQTVEYDPAVQSQHLEHLCLWALHFSSWVTPRQPDTILIETKASLHLFGGLEPFVNRLRQEALEQGLTMQIGIAPTPAAASLFAFVGDKTGVLTTQRLRPVLGDINIHSLPLDERTLKGLHKSGIKYCRDLFAIPPSALTRRFGKSCTDLVHRLLGITPEVCPAFSVPDTFSEKLDLPLEAPDVQSLQFPLNRLMSALGGFLRTHDSGVKTVEVTLHHQKTQTRVIIKFLEATSDYRHLYRVVTERLQQTTLTESIIAITIATCELETVARDERDLFQKSLNQSASVNQVIDSLSARLGRHKLYCPSSINDHRPERSWSPGDSARSGSSSQYPARPLWLLQEPARSTCPLKIKSSAERIENGWWEKLDVRRDYFIAEDQQGVHYWVYSERREPGVFFIHGIFA